MIREVREHRIRTRFKAMHTGSITEIFGWLVYKQGPGKYVIGKLQIHTNGTPMQQEDVVKKILDSGE